MKSVCLFLFFLFFLPESAFPEKVSIEGEAPAYKGERAKLVGYKDLLTKMDTVLTTASIHPADGAFKLEVECSRIRPAWVKIGNAKAKIYLEPGKDYKVKFPEIPDNKVQKAHGHTKVEMTFFDLSKHDANNLVVDLNQAYERFFVKNYHAMGLRYASGGGYSREKTKVTEKRDSMTRVSIRKAPSMEYLVDSLEKALDERYAEVEKEWFRVHYRHVMGPLWETATKDRRSIYEDFFQKEKVRPRHEEYMDHFLDFYDRYLIDFARRHDSILDLKNTLRVDKEAAPILKGLRSEDAKYMGKKGIRELVLIDGMIDAFYHREPFDKEGIHAVLDSMSRKASQKGIRTIASNVSEFLSQRQRGSIAPSFRLMDPDTNVISLEELRGAPIYLNFWASWSETSKKDMRIIHKLHQRYGEQIHFVSISTDDELKDMKQFLEQHPEYEWTFLYMGEHEEVKEAYQVASIPSYYLLDARGRFVTVPGPKPGENARAKIHRLFKEHQRREKRQRRGRGRGWDH